MIKWLTHQWQEETAVEQTLPRPRRWTRHEYERLIEQGAFGPEERLELVNGEILAMTPQKSRHASTVVILQRILSQAFATGTHCRPQLPLALSSDSEPEPDIAVVAGSDLDYLDAHPTSAGLIVEVAESTLMYDRQTKRPLYAQAGIPEYWIVNLVDRVLEVYRDPEERDGRWDYRLVQRLIPGDTVRPSGAPQATIPVAELLP
jgi:Uma2 family endonuclease